MLDYAAAADSFRAALQHAQKMRSAALEAFVYGQLAAVTAPPEPAPLNPLLSSVRTASPLSKRSPQSPIMRVASPLSHGMSPAPILNARERSYTGSSLSPLRAIPRPLPPSPIVPQTVDTKSQPVVRTPVAEPPISLVVASALEETETYLRRHEELSSVRALFDTVAAHSGGAGAGGHAQCGGRKHEAGPAGAARRARGGRGGPSCAVAAVRKAGRRCKAGGRRTLTARDCAGA